MSEIENIRKRLEELESEQTEIRQLIISHTCRDLGNVPICPLNAQKITKMQQDINVLKNKRMEKLKKTQKILDAAFDVKLNLPPDEDDYETLEDEFEISESNKWSYKLGLIEKIFISLTLSLGFFFFFCSILIGFTNTSLELAYILGIILTSSPFFIVCYLKRRKIEEDED